ADAASNEAVSPEPPAAPASFVMPTAPCADDRLAADFAQGTLASVQVATAGDGELTLAPALSTDFPGTALPAGWTSAPWGGGGTATVGGGVLTLNGAEASTSASFGPGKSLEF